LDIEASGREVFASCDWIDNVNVVAPTVAKTELNFAHRKAIALLVQQ
jgi:hypothetical protein